MTLLVKKQRRSWRGIPVNAGATILAAAAGGAVFRWLNGTEYLWRHDLETILALPGLLLMVLTFNVVNELVIVGAITLTSSRDAWPVFWRLSTSPR